MSARGETYLLPYQAAWVRDESRFKIVEKSRRIGFTYAQSYEDARYAALRSGSDVWFSSADESAAVEYIRYVTAWAEILGMAAEDLGEIVISKKDDIKARSVEFASGHRVYGLTSNPKAFRSKGGKLVLDEFAFHQDADELWKAAQPIVTWGYPVRVISTHNGKATRFNRMIEAAKKAGSDWSHHRITIHDAVDQGLADRIMKRKLTAEEREEWKRELLASVGDEATVQEEYEVIPGEAGGSYMPWNLIMGCEHADAGRPELYQGGRCFVGHDIARRRDLAVIWVSEDVGDVAWTREVILMPKMKFSEQYAEFDRVMRDYHVVRACVDQTGMGEPVVERHQEQHGSTRVEGVLFTGPVKQDLATAGKKVFEDKRVRIPIDEALRNSHNAVRREVTSAGNVRFDAAATELGHADEYWAHMLALHAKGSGPKMAVLGGHDADMKAYNPRGRGDRLRASRRR